MECCWGGLFKKRASPRSNSRRSAVHLHASNTRSGGANSGAGQAIPTESQDGFIRPASGPPIGATPMRHGGVEVYCCVGLENFDLLYSNPKFQERSVAALLGRVRSGRDEGDLGFLDRLMGLEKAQDAVRSVLCGVPYMTVVEFDLSATSCCDKHSVEKVGSGRSSVQTSRHRRSNSHGELQAVGQWGPNTLTSPHNSQHQLQHVGHLGPTSLASRELQPVGRSRPFALTSPHDSQHLPPPDAAGLKETAGAPQSMSELPSGGASIECGPRPRPEPLLVPLLGRDQGTSSECFPVGTAAAAATAAAATAPTATGAATAAPIPAEAGIEVRPTPPSGTLPFIASNSARPSLYSSTFSSGTYPPFSTGTGPPPFTASSRSTPDLETQPSPANVHAANKDFHERIGGDPASTHTLHVAAGSTQHRPSVLLGVHRSEGNAGASLDRAYKCGSPKSGGLKLSSSALSRIRAPAHRSSSGSGFDRTMTMLEVLTSSTSWGTTSSLRDSNEAPATAPAHAFPVTASSGSPGQRDSPKELEGVGKGSPGHKEAKEGFWPESGLCIGEFEPCEGSQHKGAHDAFSHPWLFGSLDGDSNKAHHVTKAEGALSVAAPASSVHHSPFQQASPDSFTRKEGKLGTATSAPESGLNRLEGIVEENANSVSGSEGAAVGRSDPSARAVRSAPPSSSEEARTEFFEVSLHPLLLGPGRRPMAMMSLANVSEQCQVQDALLSLAEGQLLLLSSFLPQVGTIFACILPCTTFLVHLCKTAGQVSQAMCENEEFMPRWKLRLQSAI
ncbi:hypothetical protein DUNSADRAFT_5461 [Dunaliella salina]|uniref:Uncharacterized protein n=1 Tax=Dunaliella salina TaxID=3046 RepID=A0ABQ7GQ89_DUNSA|nr:hypothetical protein DUNSADRAFT_5461 [Dunaliella salina]|eukprot:KAF5836771.1 hypothetical protein DUNSADRAFT_5461 [Dunaliella salina]